MLSGYEISQDQKDRQFYLSNLKGDECLCGRYKQPKYSFCHNCYYQLPLDMRMALFRPFAEGYIEAFEAAVGHLREYWETLNS